MAVLCLLAAPHVQLLNCSLTIWATDDRIVRCGVISSYQSAATSETSNPESESCKQRYSKYRTSAFFVFTSLACVVDVYVRWCLRRSWLRVLLSLTTWRSSWRSVTSTFGCVLWLTTAAVNSQSRIFTSETRSCFKHASTSTHTCSAVWGGRGSVAVRTSDLRSRGCGFDSRSGRCQVVTTQMGDCLWTGKPSRYITNTKVNSAFHPSRVGKSCTGLSGWC